MATERVFIPVTNMDSEHCALIVDKGLNKIAGVISHKVELNNRRAVIETGSAEALTNAVNVIRGLGYGVDTVTKSFPVTGLSCASCAAAVERKLHEQKGVIKDSVNFANATAMIEY